ncbi:hypothetical protein A3747_12855 [Sulfitobacter sp. HI0076]|nr:hypothetical protein A3722_18515 [Sulfitobacter sp. HI0027]KZX97976.1 hypothetical protein A3720_17060 [Sulfitobacter sp. HI0021]KZZ03165.1 hypothetical protein A3747_12855 [Sulfitobacter sp. HI0076]
MRNEILETLQRFSSREFQEEVWAGYNLDFCINSGEMYSILFDDIDIEEVDLRTLGFDHMQVMVIRQMAEIIKNYFDQQPWDKSDIKILEDPLWQENRKKLNHLYVKTFGLNFKSHYS